jgi:glycosyl transferase family 25
MDLMNKAERFKGIEHKMGFIGCSYSHLACLKMARECKYKNILIFEDDFEFLVTKDYFYKKMDILMNEEWDMLFLSYNSPKFIIMDENKIKLIESKTASGYIIREHYYDKLIDLYEQAVIKLIKTNNRNLYANDTCWRDLILKDEWYGIIDRIGKQRPSYSDLEKRMVNYGI